MSLLLRLRLPLWAAGLSFLAATCAIYSEDLLEPGTTATGGTGGTAGSGGGGTGGDAGATSSSSSGSGGSGGAAGSGGDGGSGGTGGTGGCGGAVYSHTINIDGTNDFYPLCEMFNTSSPSYTGYIAWDSVSFFIGLEGPDLAAPAATKWVLIYFDGSPGLTVGHPYNTQQPSLPFTARYHLRWKLGAANAELFVYVSGAEWPVDPNGSFTGSVGWSAANELVEIGIPLANIGGAGIRKVHVSMIDEVSNFEWSYAAIPWSSFTDSYDPGYTKHYAFDLTGSAVPSSYQPL